MHTIESRVQKTVYVEASSIYRSHGHVKTNCSHLYSVHTHSECDWWCIRWKCGSMLKAYIICMFSVKKRKYHLIDHTRLSALIVEIQFNWKAFGFYMQQIADPEGQFIWNVFKEMRVRGGMERGFWHWIYLPDKNGIHHVLLLLLWLSVVFTAHIARERTTQTISQMLFRMIRFDDQLFSQCRIFFTSPQKNTNTFAWTYVHTCMYTLHTDTNRFAQM